MSIWEEIRGKLDIVDIVGESIKLTPSGANYKCCCPFHNEKKPSLMVSPAQRGCPKPLPNPATT